MSIVFENVQLERSDLELPLLAAGAVDRPVVWRQAQPVSAARFMAHVQAVAEQLPVAPAAVNLCEDRYAFLVAFCAIALRGQTNLLPSSRAPQAVAEAMAAHPGSYALGEQALDAPPAALPAPAWSDGSAGRRRHADHSDAAGRPGGRHRLHLRFHRHAQGQPQDLGQLQRQQCGQPAHAARVGGQAFPRGRHGAAAAHVRHGDVGAAALARRRRRACRTPLAAGRRGRRAG